MENDLSFSEVFSHHTYPVLGVLGDPLNTLKTPYAISVAKTLISYFKTPENCNASEKTWNPRTQYWNVVNVDYDIEGYFSSLIDCTKERELILDATWINKFQKTPAVLISIFELSNDDSPLITAIKNIGQNTSLSHTAVIIVDQIQYESSSTDSRIAEILKHSGLDSKHLAISRPGNKAYIKEFLGGLEGDLWVDSMFFYGSKISKRQHKIGLQLPLIESEKGDINITQPNPENKSKGSDKWYYYGRGKLIRHYIKQSYFSECCNESELKKMCIKESYRQIQLYLNELSRSVQQDFNSGEFIDSKVEAYIRKNIHWCEAMCIMNSLCVRMEREAIREWQESPRVQHLQNLLQVLQNSKIVSSFYSWYLISQSLESLLPIHSLAFDAGKGVPSASYSENIDYRLLEIAPVQPQNIGFLHYSIATILYECSKALEKENINEFTIASGNQEIKISISSIWKKALNHLIESENYYASKLWSLRINSTIADLLIKLGNTELGIKKLRSVIEFYREQRWGLLLENSLEILKNYGTMENKFMCLLELSSSKKTSSSAIEWMDFLESGKIENDLSIDMSTILPVIICKPIFFKNPKNSLKKLKFRITLLNQLPHPIKFDELNVEFEPKSCCTICLNSVEIKNKRYVIEGDASIPDGTASIHIVRVSGLIKKNGVNVEFFWNFPQNRSKATFKYAISDNSVDFDFIEIEKLLPAISGEIIPFSIKVINKGTEKTTKSKVLFSLENKNNGKEIETRTVDIVGLNINESTIVTEEFKLPESVGVSTLYLKAKVESEFEYFGKTQLEKGIEVPTVYPLSVAINEIKDKIQVESTNITNSLLNLWIPGIFESEIPPTKSYVFLVPNKPDTLKFNIRRITDYEDEKLKEIKNKSFEQDYSLVYQNLEENSKKLVVVDSECEPYATFGKPFLLKYIIENLSDSLTSLLINVYPTEGLVFSGHRKLTLSLLPYEKTELLYTLVFLGYRNALPRVDIQIVSNSKDTTPAGDKIIGLGQLEVAVKRHYPAIDGIIRRDRSSICVIP
ncbi:hypothetical protein AYI69_g938 [Smittium culicis]|uniref:Trafficking protein particle complex subunit 11 n=1 Tax=Smittium culicis TaxID=133412 RepID=A0A1R1YS01_9FUNG|nr:hypothetical protein AYI69_g938 [Smittium culicis]